MSEAYVRLLRQTKITYSIKKQSFARELRAKNASCDELTGARVLAVAEISD